MTRKKDRAYREAVKVVKPYPIPDAILREILADDIALAIRRATARAVRAVKSERYPDAIIEDIKRGEL